MSHSSADELLLHIAAAAVAAASAKDALDRAQCSSITDVSGAHVSSLVVDLVVRLEKGILINVSVQIARLILKQACH